MSREDEKDQMRLDVPLFRQTTDFTCGACATLMVWKYFDRSVELSRRNEFLIWTETAALPFKFSSPYRIAEFFIKKGFETKVLANQETSSEGRTPLECCQVEPSERRLFLDFLEAHNEILRRRIASAILDKKPALPDIGEALSAYRLAILLVDSYYTLEARGARKPVRLPHWIVVTGHDGDKFYVNDSIHERGLRNGKTMLVGQAHGEAMDTYPRFGWPSALIVVGLKAGE